MRAVCKPCDLTGVNQTSCTKPVLVKKGTAPLSERINTFMLFSCLCILVGGRKRVSKKCCRILVSL